MKIMPKKRANFKKSTFLPKMRKNQLTRQKKDFKLGCSWPLGNMNSFCYVFYESLISRPMVSRNYTCR